MKLLDKCLCKVGKSFARMFVAGDTMEDALRVAAELNKKGIEAIINYLGEEVRERDQVQDNVQIYLNLIRKIQCREIRARFSVKPSQLGLKIDPRFYWLQLWQVGRRAFLYNVPLEIDIETEDTVVETVQGTIALAKNFPGLDLRQALAVNFKDSFVHLYNLTANGVKVRLCKGAYPPSYDEKTIAQKYLNAASWLLRSKSNPDFATHDLRLLNRIFLIRNIYPSLCGFQFLLGLRKKTWKKLAGQGERIAIYVPFGAHWLSYAKRRWIYILKKIPSIIAGN